MSGNTGQARAFHRTEMIPPKPPPAATSGVIGWLRENLFSSWWNTLLTIIGLYIIWLIVSFLVQFAILDAVWEGKDRTACLAQDGGEVGACWAFVKARMGQLLYGFYPEAERWRVKLLYAVGIVLLIPMLIPAAPFNG